MPSTPAPRKNASPPCSPVTPALRDPGSRDAGLQLLCLAAAGRPVHHSHHAHAHHAMYATTSDPTAAAAYAHAHLPTQHHLHHHHLAYAHPAAAAAAAIHAPTAYAISAPPPPQHVLAPPPATTYLPYALAYAHPHPHTHAPPLYAAAAATAAATATQPSSAQRDPSASITVSHALPIPVHPAVSHTRVPTATETDGVRKVKGPWRPEEDKLLTELVGRFGARRWTAIAAHIPGRTGKQARERWLNQLSPDLAKRAWNSEEDRIVMQAHARLGNRWSEIAKLLEGRTDNAVKNRFNTTIRRQISERARAEISGNTVAKNDMVAAASPVSSSENLKCSPVPDSSTSAPCSVVGGKRKLDVAVDSSARANAPGPVQQRMKVMTIQAQ